MHAHEHAPTLLKSFSTYLVELLLIWFVLFLLLCWILLSVSNCGTTQDNVLSALSFLSTIISFEFSRAHYTIGEFFMIFSLVPLRFSTSTWTQPRISFFLHLAKEMQNDHFLKNSLRSNKQIIVHRTLHRAELKEARKREAGFCPQQSRNRDEKTKQKWIWEQFQINILASLRYVAISGICTKETLETGVIRNGEAVSRKGSLELARVAMRR